MRVIALSVAGLLVGGLFVVYGALLVWRPDLFLRFHDAVISRSAWSKNTEWRKHVHEREYRFYGLAFCAVGLFFMIVMLMRLISNQA